MSGAYLKVKTPDGWRDLGEVKEFAMSFEPDLRCVVEEALRQQAARSMRPVRPRHVEEFTVTTDELRAAGPGFEVRVPGMELD